MKCRYAALVGIMGLCLFASWPPGAPASQAERLLPTQLTANDAAVPDASDAGTRQKPAPPTYAQVDAILQKHCIMCHAGPKAGGRLRLETYAHVMTGGSKGPAVVPKSPEESELLRRIRGTSQPRMPLNGPPWLAESETALIDQWIALGATDTPLAGDPDTLPKPQTATPSI